MKINFNGKEYNSVQSMPSEIKEQYLQVIQVLGDKNRNGIPDIIEKKDLINVHFDHKISINGKEYESVTQMPADVREIYEKLQSIPMDSSKAQIDVQTTHTKNFLLQNEMPILSLKVNSSSGMWWGVFALLFLLLATIVLWASGTKFSDLFNFNSALW